jgi:hypothetical protein
MIILLKANNIYQKRTLNYKFWTYNRGFKSTQPKIGLVASYFANEHFVRARTEYACLGISNKKMEENKNVFQEIIYEQKQFMR